MSEPLAPLPDSAFDGERTVVTTPPQKCTHYLIRRTRENVECCNCAAGWIDNGRWKILDGKIVG